MVCFEWTFKGYGHSETFKQKMRCDSAIKSVPFPQPWKTTIKVVTRIDRMRRDAIVEASRLIESSPCECRLLGVPKPQEVLDELCGSPVAVVFLTCPRAGRQGFLLCARVVGDVWLCHPGTLADGAICADRPFDFNDLSARDIVADRFDAFAMPRARIRHRTEVNLLEAVAAHPIEWSRIRSIAIWKAEELRTESGQIDIERASAGFERNPFRWNCDGWFSRIRICLFGHCGRGQSDTNMFLSKKAMCLIQKRPSHNQKR